MNILLITEGARADAGGLGLVGVPPTARALAQMGHRVLLDILGPLIPGSEPFGCQYPDGADDPFGPDLAAISYPAFGRWALSPAALKSIRHHVSCADFVSLHSLYSFPVLAGALAAWSYGKRYGVWPHGVLAPFQRTVGARKKAVYNRLIADRILRKADVLFFSSPGERTEAKVPFSVRSVIIPHGIALEELSQLPPRGAFRARYLNGSDAPLALFLGRLNAKKGLDLLLNSLSLAARSIPAIHLAIVGAGDPPSFVEQVHKWARAAGVQDRVVLTGLLTGQEKLAALADADVLVLPSQAENFSFAMFEAMAARVPVVVSDTLNLAGEVAQAGAGLVVPRSPAAFAEAIAAVLSDPSVRSQMGAKGFELAGKYSWSRIALMIERTIEALLSKRYLPPDLTL